MECTGPTAARILAAWLLLNALPIETFQGWILFVRAAERSYIGGGAAACACGGGGSASFHFDGSRSASGSGRMREASR